MPTRTLIQWSAPLFALGAVAFALFIYISNGEFTGAELGLSTRHHVAHVSHFYSALFFLFGIIGFYAAHRERSGRLGVVAFVVAIAGAALFCATGVITGFVWRTISAHAPQLVSADGAFFNPPLAVIFIASTTFAAGHVLLGIVAWRARMLPRIAVLLYVTGAVLTVAPPPPWGPTPYVVIDAGATLFMIGACWLALALWERSGVAAVASAYPIRAAVDA